MGKNIWLIPLIGSFGAAGAALGAWWAAWQTRKSVLAQVLMEITDAYSAEEMLEGMIKLNEWKAQHGKDFAKIFGKLRLQDYSKVEDIDKARRIFSHHFHKLRRLIDTRTVSERFVRKLVSRGQVDFLHHVIEPLEEALNPDYDQATFDTFRKLYKIKLIKNGLPATSTA